ncbi:MAG: VWA domain-containing protein [Candidatus Hydrogenedentes bacterium]|nr:VWA domain-containing protein [Candidatus Hydrogenedentota bacterium]
MYFAFPWKYLPLWLLSVLLLTSFVVISLIIYENSREKKKLLFADKILFEKLVVGYSKVLRTLSIVLSSLLIVFILLAIAQPHWGSAWVKQQKVARDIMILIDVSESMMAGDLPPNRLERVKQKINILLDRCQGDRFGILAFSGESQLICPLTLDLGYIKTVINAMNTDMLSKEGTNLAGALEELKKVFSEDIKESGEDKYSRALILFTDGEDLSTASDDVLEFLKKYVSVVVVGVGTPEGAEISFPEWMKKHVRTSNIKLTHRSCLNEERLKGIALESQGFYLRMTPDDKDIEFILNELEKLRKIFQSDEIRFQKVNRYRWPLSVACILLAMDSILWYAIFSKKSTKKVLED